MPDAPRRSPSFRRADLGFRLAVLVGTASYLALLTSIYLFHISPRFSYLGYTLEPAPTGYLAVALFAAWLPALWMPVRLTRPSEAVYWILFVLVYVPSAIIPFLGLGDMPNRQLSLLGMLVGSFSAVALIYRLPNVALTRLKIAPRIYWSILAIAVTVLVALVVSRTGFRFHVPSLLDVYDVRSDFKGVSGQRIVSYGVSWLGNVLFPFAIATGLIARRFPILAVGILGQIFIYSLTGYRSVLFSTGLLLVLLMAMGQKGRRFGLAVIGGSCAVVAGSWLLDAIGQTVVFSSLFVRRLIVTPGILTGWYHDFFSDHPKAMLGHSVLEGLVAYPYDRVPPLLIGREYFGREGTYANANLWADAYSNFGVGGVGVYTLVLMLILLLFDGLVHRRGWPQVKLAVLLLGVPAFTLSNTALVTTLMTHGAALTWLVLYLLPRDLMTRAGRSRSPLRTWSGNTDERTT